MNNIEITQPGEVQIKELDIAQWCPWECEPSVFEWTYDDEEWCFIFEGRAIIKTAKQEKIEIKKGDLVKFPKQLKCTWQVLEKIRKVYIFK
jgi:uncharacterized protein